MILQTMEVLEEGYNLIRVVFQREQLSEVRVWWLVNPLGSRGILRGRASACGIFLQIKMYVILSV